MCVPAVSNLKNFVKMVQQRGLQPFKIRSIGVGGVFARMRIGHTLEAGKQAVEITPVEALQEQEAVIVEQMEDVQRGFMLRWAFHVVDLVDDLVQLHRTGR